jgi:hypothetical protein
MRCQGYFGTDRFPENSSCVGTTDDWLAMDFTDAHTRTHAYSLENIFSKKTVPVPELNTIIGNVSELFEVRKVLMKSPPIGLIAVRTNYINYLIILIQPGKGLWFPEPQTSMLTHIIDIAFLGDELYGITHDEDLISLSLTVDSHGAPTVTSIKCVIPHDGYKGFDVPCKVSVPDDLDMDNEDNNAEAETMDYEDVNNMGDNDGAPREEGVAEELYINNEGISYELDDEEPYEDLIFTIWYLVESHGKLLMLRRQLQRPDRITRFIRRVEVFEADRSTNKWVPVLGGLDGHALFISKGFSKSVFFGWRSRGRCNLFYRHR